MTLKGKITGRYSISCFLCDFVVAEYGTADTDIWARFTETKKAWKRLADGRWICPLCVANGGKKNDVFVLERAGR